MKKALALLLIVATVCADAQTVLTVGNSVLHSGVLRAGIDPSYLSDFGNQQYLKSLFYADGGDLPAYTIGTTFVCSTGAQTASTWFFSGNNPNGYATDAFKTATYSARNSATGALLGTGTITGSTASTGGTGPSLSLSPAMTGACSPTNQDVIEIMQRSVTQQMTPLQLFGATGANISGTLSFDYADIDPAATNTYQSLVFQPGAVLTMATDQIQANQSNPNPALQPVQVNNINLNGTYTWSFKYKCGSASGTGNMTMLLYRGSNIGSPFATTTVTPACNAANTAGWATATGTFTASETGSQNSNLDYKLTNNSGSTVMKTTEMDVVEGTALAGGNPTVFRDDVIRTLQKLKPGVIRFMGPGDWCSNEADMTQPMQNIRWCNVNPLTAYNFKPALGYNEELQICAFIGSDCAISVGQFNQPSDWVALMNWASTNSNYLALVAAGHKVYWEHGNEAFNSAAGGTLFYGDGIPYGAWVGADFSISGGARSAAGFDAAHMKLIANSFWASNQAWSGGNFGWAYNVLHNASLSAGGCPDGMELAPYNGPGFIGTDAGGTAGEPYLGLLTNVINWDSVTSLSAGQLSMYGAANWLANTQTVCTSPTPFPFVYEVGDGMVAGPGGTTQSRTNQITGGAGQALALTLHHQLMIRDAGILGPLGTFALGEGFTGYTCGYTSSNNVATTSSGGGTGLKLDVTASNGVITGGSIHTGAAGTGYTTSDIAFPVMTGGATANFTVTASGGVPSSVSLNTGGASCPSPLVTAAWGIERIMPCGPGQLNTCAADDRPQSILLQTINNAIGGNSNMMTVSTASDPTYNYAGGQPQAGTNQVFANSAVPKVQGFSYSDGSGHWTTIVYNIDLVNSQAITLAGTGAPGSATVTKWTYPAPGETVASNNEACYIADCSLAQDFAPTPSTAASGNSYTIPAGSVLVMTHTVGGASGMSVASGVVLSGATLK